MEKVLEFIKGRKTYAVALAITITAILKYRGISIPEETWVILAALGLGFLRAGVQKANGNSNDKKKEK